MKTASKTLNMKSIITLTALGLALVLALAAGAQAAGSEVLKGRDYASRGTLGSLSGTLIDDDGEWSLKAGDAVYELHLGPPSFREDKGLTLTEGATAEVSGFIYQNHVSVTQMTAGGETVTLRGDDGRPAWAGTGYVRGDRSGQGYRTGAQDGAGSRAGRGR